jgi:hypothetical protein
LSEASRATTAQHLRFGVLPSGIEIIADPNIPKLHGSGRFRPPTDWPFTDWETAWLPASHWAVKFGFTKDEIMEPLFYCITERDWLQSLEPESQRIP